MDNPAYQVGFPSRRASKEFTRFLEKVSPKDRRQIFEALDGLAQSPRFAGKSFKFLKGAIPIFGYLAQYRLRVGDYRIFYDVDDAKRKVVLLAVRRRHERTYDY